MSSQTSQPYEQSVDRVLEAAVADEDTVQVLTDRLDMNRNTSTTPPSHGAGSPIADNNRLGSEPNVNSLRRSSAQDGCDVFSVESNDTATIVRMGESKSSTAGTVPLHKLSESSTRLQFPSSSKSITQQEFTQKADKDLATKAEDVPSLRKHVKDLLNLKLAIFLDTHEQRLRELYIITTHRSLADLLHFRSAGPPEMEAFVTKNRVDGVATSRIGTAKRKTSEDTPASSPKRANVSSPTNLPIPRSLNEREAGVSSPTRITSQLDSPATTLTDSLNEATARNRTSKDYDKGKGNSFGTVKDKSNGIEKGKGEGKEKGTGKGKGKGKGEGTGKGTGKGKGKGKGKGIGNNASGRYVFDSRNNNLAESADSGMTDVKQTQKPTIEENYHNKSTRDQNFTKSLIIDRPGQESSVRDEIPSIDTIARPTPAVPVSSHFQGTSTAIRAKFPSKRTSKTSIKIKPDVHPPDDSALYLKKSATMSSAPRLTVDSSNLKLSTRASTKARKERSYHNDKKKYSIQTQETTTQSKKQKKASPEEATAMLKREAELIAHVNELKQQGRWVEHKLPKVAEPARPKVHWDYLLEEMEWLSDDYRMERKWKIAAARKLARAVIKWHDSRAQDGVRRMRLEQSRKRKVAANVAKDVQLFWKQMLKVVDYKHKLSLDAVKTDAMNKHLDFLVGQTESFTEDVTKGLQQTYHQFGQNTVQERAARLSRKHVEMLREAAKPSDKNLQNRSSPTEVGLLSKEDALPEESDGEFIPDTGEEMKQEDDESTIEDEDEPDDAGAELADLAKGETVPISELLAMYEKMESVDTGSSDGEVTTDEAVEILNGTSEKSNSNTGNHSKEASGSEQQSQLERATSLSPSKVGSDVNMHSRSYASEMHDDYSDINTEENDYGNIEHQSENLKAEIEKTRGSCQNNVYEDDHKEEDSNTIRDLMLLAGKRLTNQEPRTPDEVEAIASTLSPLHSENDFDVSQIGTPVPFLLKHKLRPYQHIGLDWLATMHAKNLNGILADEMGLGKTIQTIAFLAHLAISRNNWGPHLIIVPTSVMVNWEMEIKKWCPAFKILNYHGTIRQRKEKRVGWTKQDQFHICITSYKLAVQDAHIFKRKRWKYLILDEAHHIKNFESKRWQTLLRFTARRRLLLTGTPLQNDLMELWSLLHFLMPRVFQSHQQFREWFGNPVREMVETAQTRKNQDKERVMRLHKLLRPFILRRLKIDVEVQMPKKYEHVIMCDLSRRQRELYDEFMSRTKTKETIAAGNYLSVINILMQLRKVCNHPNLFAAPQVQSPLVLEPLRYTVPSLVLNVCDERDWFSETPHSARINLDLLGFALLHYVCRGDTKLKHDPACIQALHLPIGFELLKGMVSAEHFDQGGSSYADVLLRRRTAQQSVLNQRSLINSYLCQHQAIYPAKLLHILLVARSYTLSHYHSDSAHATSVVHRQQLQPLLDRFTIYTPAARSTTLCLDATTVAGNWRIKQQMWSEPMRNRACTRPTLFQSLLHSVLADDTILILPDRSLIQYHCAKLQVLEKVLREKKKNGHRALIFTQMSKMLDILEQFLTYHGFTYLRLDGTTPIVRRQQMTERFNRDYRVFCFILSTRSGGLGVNLTGADTVVFYDSDWNPTMDAQAQDRCHRIGQTRDVHIYRLISSKTVEENILKKAQQKQQLGKVAIEQGAFTTETLRGSGLRDLFEGEASLPHILVEKEQSFCSEKSFLETTSVEKALWMAEDETDRQALESARNELSQEFDEFQEDRKSEVSNERQSSSPYPRSTSTDTNTIPSLPSKIENERQEVGDSLLEVQNPTQFYSSSSQQQCNMPEEKNLAAIRDTTDISADSSTHKLEIQDERHTSNASDLSTHSQKKLELSSSMKQKISHHSDVDSVQLLEEQMKQLRGVEHHALLVLERYLSAHHQAQLDEARKAMEVKHRTLCDLQNRMRVSNDDDLSTDEEFELFYDEEQMQDAIQAYAEATAMTEDTISPVYTPPQPPFDGTGQAMAPHVETAHWAQYRVAFMHFVPDQPDLSRRRKRHRKKYKDLQKRPDKHKLNVAWQRVMDLGIRDIAERRARELGDKVLSCGRGIAASIFRLRDDKGGRYGIKMHRHLKRPTKAITWTKDKRDIDTNRGAPQWSIEEDWALLSTIRKHLCVNSTVNWHLVANTLNLTTSFSGRYRSWMQCRDRYFNVLIAREEGRQSAPIPKEDTKKRSKKRKDESSKPKIGETTQQLHERDNRKSVIDFHRSVFTAIGKAHATRQRAIPIPAPSKDALLVQQELLKSVDSKITSAHQLTSKLHADHLRMRQDLVNRQRLKLLQAQQQAQQARNMAPHQQQSMYSSQQPNIQHPGQQTQIQATLAQTHQQKEQQHRQLTPQHMQPSLAQQQAIYPSTTNTYSLRVQPPLSSHIHNPTPSQQQHDLHHHHHLQQYVHQQQNPRFVDRSQASQLPIKSTSRNISRHPSIQDGSHTLSASSASVTQSHGKLSALPSPQINTHAQSMNLPTFQQTTVPHYHSGIHSSSTNLHPSHGNTPIPISATSVTKGYPYTQTPIHAASTNIAGQQARGAQINSTLTQTSSNAQGYNHLTGLSSPRQLPSRYVPTAMARVPPSNSVYSSSTPTALSGGAHTHIGPAGNSTSPLPPSTSPMLEQIGPSLSFTSSQSSTIGSVSSVMNPNSTPSTPTGALQMSATATMVNNANPRNYSNALSGAVGSIGGDGSSTMLTNTTIPTAKYAHSTIAGPALQRRPTSNTYLSGSSLSTKPSTTSSMSSSSLLSYAQAHLKDSPSYSYILNIFQDSNISEEVKVDEMRRMVQQSQSPSRRRLSSSIPNATTLAGSVARPMVSINAAAGSHYQTPMSSTPSTLSMQYSQGVEISSTTGTNLTDFNRHG